VHIAAVQLAYHPAYFEREKELLAYPLIKSVDTGDIIWNRKVAEWRQQLITTYCQFFQRKLERIVRTCLLHCCDLIIFPEYSVPLECLNRLRELSQENSIAILAGSHRINTQHPQFGEILPEIHDKTLHGRAIAPLFVNGQATIITKLIGSRYDRCVSVNSEKVQNVESVEISGQKIRFWICSDYLQNNIAQDEKSDFEIVVSYTPALGDFAVRNQQKTASDNAMKRAHKTQKVAKSSAVIFVNNAKRGGTKVFFQNRSPDGLAMETSDGTYGECVIDTNRVTRCGIEPNTEGIIITELMSSESGVEASQYAVIPILHCSSPDDTPTNALVEFIGDYYRADGIDTKKQFLRNRLPFVSKQVLNISNHILNKKYRHIEANLNLIHEEDLLDRLVAAVCIIHEEAPSLPVWIHRACTSTSDLLNAIRIRLSSSTESIDEAIRDIQHCLSEVTCCREVVISEAASGKTITPITSVQHLEFSGPFRARVADSHSGSAASEYGIRLVHHLLRVGETKDALRVADQIRTFRPYLAFQIVDNLLDILRTRAPDIEGAIELCESFLAERCTEMKMLKEIFAKLDPIPIGGILVNGYSEIVLLLLRAFRGRKPPIVVTECRNRAHIGSSVICAKKLESYGFQVSYVSDATVARVLYRKRPPIGTVLMGFNLAGPEGVINSVGSLGVASLAKQVDARVVFVGQTYKIVSGEKWEMLYRNALESELGAPWLEERTHLELHSIRIADPQSDLIPWNTIDSVITEKGELDPNDIQAQWE